MCASRIASLGTQQMSNQRLKTDPLLSSSCLFFLLPRPLHIVSLWHLLLLLFSLLCFLLHFQVWQAAADVFSNDLSLLIVTTSLVWAVSRDLLLMNGIGQRYVTSMISSHSHTHKLRLSS